MGAVLERGSEMIVIWDISEIEFYVNSGFEVVEML